MTESPDNNLVPKPNQGLVRLGKSSLMSRGRELATRQTEIEQVKGYRCVAWGDNEYGACNVPEGERFIQVSAGTFISAGIRPDGRVVLWGNTEFQFPEGERFVNVVCTLRHAYGLRSDGTVKPLNLGCDDEDFESAYNEEFAGFPFTQKFVQITGAYECFLGLRSDGTVATWHRGEGNKHGHCDVPEDEKFIQIACGGECAVGLRHDGSVLTWGTESPKINFSNEDRFVSISAGSSHATGIRSDGSFVVSGFIGGFDSREFDGDPYRGSEIHWGFLNGCLLLPDRSAILVHYNGELEMSDEMTPPTDLKFSKLSASKFHCLGLVID